MTILHKLKQSWDNLACITNSNFGLLDEVSSWTEDLQAFRQIKSQKYWMLTSVYTAEEIDQVEDSVDLIKDGTKSMMTLYDQIKEVEKRAKDQIMEADKLYSAASMEIFTDNSMDELVIIEVVVQQFRSSFEGVRDHIDLQRIFRLEDILNKLDDMLNDFGALR